MNAKPEQTILSMVVDLEKVFSVERALAVHKGANSDTVGKVT
jgi:hypothetical protein